MENELVVRSVGLDTISYAALNPKWGFRVAKPWRWVILGLLFIGSCSVYDAYLVYAYRAVIDEENRFCRWLISLEPENVSVFLAAKLMGTGIVLACLFWLSRYRLRLGATAVAGLVAFQLGLMGYLHFFDSVSRMGQIEYAQSQIDLQGRQALAASLKTQQPIGQIAQNDPQRTSREKRRGASRRKRESFYRQRVFWIKQALREG